MVGRTKSWKVKDYYVWDLPEYDLETLQPHNELADVVFCLEVFEYLINPYIAMKNIKNILKKGGTAYISFPLIYPLHNEVKFDSIRFTESGVRRLAQAVGLEVKDVYYRRTKPREEIDSLINGDASDLVKYYRHDGMKAARGFDHEITGYIVKFKR